MENYLIISTICSEKTPIIKELSELIAQTGCSIIDTRMTLLCSEFAMVMLLVGNWDAIAKIESKLPAFKKKHKVKLIATRTEQPTLEGEFLPYFVQITTQDKPGVISEITNFFVIEKINITELEVHTYTNPYSPTLMATLALTILVPTDTMLPDLRERFLVFCDGLNIDAVLEPIKG